MRVALRPLVDAARAGGWAVPCFNVFGLEDVVAVVRAAEARDAPAILATNRETVELFGLEAIVGGFGALAAAARVPICLHLDHADAVARCTAAVDAGFDSVMYDGSQLPFDENVANTRAVVEYAHAAGVSVEGEIGSVAYDAADNRGREHVRDEPTEPAVARDFVRATGVDAVAVSIGNVHRRAGAARPLDLERLARIAAAVERPLVLHGTSGVDEATLAAVAAGAVCKCNIGTALRRAFGRALRGTLAAHPERFDRLEIFADVIPALADEAGRYIERLGAGNRAGDIAGGV